MTGLYLWSTDSIGNNFVIFDVQRYKKQDFVVFASTVVLNTKSNNGEFNFLPILYNAKDESLQLVDDGKGLVQIPSSTTNTSIDSLKALEYISCVKVFGDFLYCATKSVIQRFKFQDMSEYKNIRISIDGGEDDGNHYGISCIDVNKDIIVVGLHNNCIKCFNRDDLKFKWKNKHPSSEDSVQGITCIGIHPSNGLVYSSGWDKHIRCWTVGDGNPGLFDGSHIWAVRAFVFHQENRLISGGHDKLIRFWNLQPQQWQSTNILEIHVVAENDNYLYIGGKVSDKFSVQKRTLSNRALLTGKKKDLLHWRRDIGGASRPRDMTFSDAHVFVGTVNCCFVILDKKFGVIKQIISPTQNWVDRIFVIDKIVISINRIDADPQLIHFYDYDTANEFNPIEPKAKSSEANEVEPDAKSAEADPISPKVKWTQRFLNIWEHAVRVIGGIKEAKSAEANPIVPEAKSPKVVPVTPKVKWMQKFLNIREHAVIVKGGIKEVKSVHTLVVASNTELQLYDISTGELLGTVPSPSNHLIRTVLTNDDFNGKLLIVLNNNIVYEIRIRSGGHSSNEIRSGRDSSYELTEVINMHSFLDNIGEAENALFKLASVTTPTTYFSRRTSSRKLYAVMAMKTKVVVAEVTFSYRNRSNCFQRIKEKDIELPHFDGDIESDNNNTAITKIEIQNTTIFAIFFNTVFALDLYTGQQLFILDKIHSHLIDHLLVIQDKYLVTGSSCEMKAHDIPVLRRTAVPCCIFDFEKVAVADQKAAEEAKAKETVVEEENDEKSIMDNIYKILENILSQCSKLFAAVLNAVDFINEYSYKPLFDFILGCIFFIINVFQISSFAFSKVPSTAGYADFQSALYGFQQAFFSSDTTTSSNTTSNTTSSITYQTQLYIFWGFMIFYICWFYLHDKISVQAFKDSDSIYNKILMAADYVVSVVSGPLLIPIVASCVSSVACTHGLHGNLRSQLSISCGSSHHIGIAVTSFLLLSLFLLNVFRIKLRGDRIGAIEMRYNPLDFSGDQIMSPTKSNPLSIMSYVYSIVDLFSSVSFVIIQLFASIKVSVILNFVIAVIQLLAVPIIRPFADVTTNRVVIGTRVVITWNFLIALVSGFVKNNETIYNLFWGEFLIAVMTIITILFLRKFYPENFSLSTLFRYYLN